MDAIYCHPFYFSSALRKLIFFFFNLFIRFISHKRESNNNRVNTECYTFLTKFAFLLHTQKDLIYTCWPNAWLFPNVLLKSMIEYRFIYVKCIPSVTSFALVRNIHRCNRNVLTLKTSTLIKYLKTVQTLSATTFSTTNNTAVYSV